MNTVLTIYLSDDSKNSFTKFDEAIDFCEKEFGFEGEYWDLILLNRSLYELYDFLMDENIDAEFFEQ